MCSGIDRSLLWECSECALGGLAVSVWLWQEGEALQVGWGNGIAVRIEGKRILKIVVSGRSRVSRLSSASGKGAETIRWG